MDRIDRYQIVSVAEGTGAGLVYRVFDELLNKTFAMKLYRNENKEHRDRLLARLNEISTRVGSSHRNLATAFDWGEDNDVVFAITDDSDSRTLSDVMDKSAGVDIVEKLSYMMQSAAALRYAHSKGIPHGHLNPSNILVLSDGQIKITDLGIGSQFAKGGKGGNSPTKLGPLIQTLAYQAPEQFEGVPCPASDIFAFGVIFFHLLTGEHPFQKSENKNLGMLVQNILRGNPPPMKFDGVPCPPSLEKLVLRTIQKAPKDRYATFEEIQTDLNPIVSQFETEWAETRVKECERLFEEGKTGDARSCLLNVLRRSPSAPAATRLRRKIQEVTQSPEARERCEKLLQTGRWAFEQQEYEQAIEDFNAALDLDPLAIEASMLKDEATLILGRLQRVHLFWEQGLREAQAKHLDQASRMADRFLSETIDLLPLANMRSQSAVRIQELVVAIHTIGAD